MSLSVIIAASGQGKRLYSESLETPKPMFVFQGKPIIAHLIDIYKKISNNIIITVANNKGGQLLKSWLKDYYKNANWITIIEQPHQIGTNDAVSKAFDYVNNDCLISWCDFILDENEFLNIFKNLNENCFFTSNIDCRFGIENKKIKEINSNPGFLGIYYLKNKIQLDLKKEDFIENFINQEIKTINIKSINLGTVCELVQNNAFKSQSNRFFNKIDFTDTTVIKTALTEEAKILQEKEINWYKNCPAKLKKYLPKFDYDSNHIILERIFAKPITECILDKSFWKHKLPELMNALHQPTDQIVNINSCISTYVQKPKQRLSEVQNIIDVWFDQNKIINGLDFSKWTFPETPKDLIPKNFTFIHGDLQFSNSMICENGDIKIIDPRGYFGNTLLFGDPAYDIAKILYAVDAYHKINERKFAIHKISNGNTIFIHKPDIEINEDVKWFFKWACDKYEISKEKLNFILFGIWMSLTSYICNDPLAVVAAYSKAVIRTQETIL